MSTTEWEEKRVLFDEKNGRMRSNAELSARAKFTKEYVLSQFSQSFAEGKFDLENAIQTKAEFCFPIAVMDKTEDWEEDS